MYVFAKERNVSIYSQPGGGLVVTPLATEEIGAMGREIESRRGIGW
jgi:hypothetical protein